MYPVVLAGSDSEEDSAGVPRVQGYIHSCVGLGLGLAFHDYAPA